MSAAEGDVIKHKSHRERHSGRKADKKKEKKHDLNELTAKQRNPKAFTFNSAVKAERQFRRKQDLDTKKTHIPEVDRTPVEPPPILVAVVGPPKVGKSTLIRNLIKCYTKHPFTNVLGPVTVVTGKRQRVTFIECNNDLNAMIDIAKIADLVLLLIDASFGFEMEIFEFLNICQVHGMPRIMGVLTHLDLIKNSSQLRKTKKTLKHRFWTEVYDGAKLFYLSGLLHEEYLRTEVKNLARFISVMKFRPLLWRTTHPYVLTDRIEDLTDPELIRQNPKADRNVSLYGYVRGVPLHKETSIHIPGCGDLKIKDISFLPDPCPLPDHLKKRALVEKERLIYAPFSGVGGIVYDKDGVYVELGGSHSHAADDTGFISQLLQTQETLDHKLEQSELQIFSNSAPIKSRDVLEQDETEKLDKEINSDDDEENSENEDSDEEEEETSDEETEEKSDEDDEENSDEEEKEDSEDDDDGYTRWKQNLAEKARDAFLNRQQTNVNIMKLVYGVFEEPEIEPEADAENDSEEIGGLFKVVKEKQRQKLEDRELKNKEECVFFSIKPSRDWSDEDNRRLIANRFVTGQWKESEDAEHLLKLDDLDDEVDGDFEDLETGEVHKAEAPKEMDLDETDEKKKLLEKKQQLKKQFDSEYDNDEGKSHYEDLKKEVERQAQLNKSEFEGLDDDVRVQLEGYRPGMYVRVEIDTVPCELITNLDPSYPMIIGGLLHGEENIGYVQARIKKHRWYKKILKTKDPLIISAGWRRFQTLPIYAKLEDNMRQRMLKYTPEHVSCMAHFWGPIVPQGTGILAIQEVAQRQTKDFRIIATGTIVELDKSTQVMKKLKLIGEPMKIYKKTALIKDMFTSTLEVAKFEGAKIQTVSGIRGQIKKPERRYEGVFRGTFEDQIRLSDIVFCRTWYKVDIPKFYNPVISLLLPLSQKNQWQGMRTTAQLKREMNIHAEANTDSMYTPIEREPKVFKPLYIPTNLQKALPYRDKPKLLPLAENRITKFQDKRVVVVREPKEEKIARLMKMVRTNYVHKQESLKKAMNKRITDYQKRVEEETEKKLKRQRVLKKQVFRDLTMKAKKRK